MRQRFVTGQWVPYPIDEVFPFFANPANLLLLTPEPLKMRIDALKLAQASAPPSIGVDEFAQPKIAAGVGTEMELSFQPVSYLPTRVSWVARITEFAWFDHFCDEQVGGPFAFFRHRHGVHAEMQEGRMGTKLTDDVEFEMPFGLIGWLSGGAVRWQMEQMFRIRQERLPAILKNWVRA
ncbi:MAG: SRPBCC family protein [Acidobacteria bacterium]|nr:SRPBCC family protein [Acidobacteriota bacterium]